MNSINGNMVKRVLSELFTSETMCVKLVTICINQYPRSTVALSFTKVDDRSLRQTIAWKSFNRCTWHWKEPGSKVSFLISMTIHLFSKIQSSPATAQISLLILRSCVMEIAVLIERAYTLTSGRTRWPLVSAHVFNITLIFSPVQRNTKAKAPERYKRACLSLPYLRGVCRLLYLRPNVASVCDQHASILLPVRMHLVPCRLIGVLNNTLRFVLRVWTLLLLCSRFWCLLGDFPPVCVTSRARTGMIGPSRRVSWRRQKSGFWTAAELTRHD